MQARRVRLEPGKTRCHRCQQDRAPIHECAFSFRESYSHWKALWQARTGKRLTNRRKARLREKEEEQLDLKALSGITYFMDMCSECFAECSVEVRDQFPQEAWETLLRSPAPNRGSASSFVPTKMRQPAFEGMALSTEGEGP